MGISKKGLRQLEMMTERERLGRERRFAARVERVYSYLAAPRPAGFECLWPSPLRLVARNDIVLSRPLFALAVSQGQQAVNSTARRKAALWEVYYLAKEIENVGTHAGVHLWKLAMKEIIRLATEGISTQAADDIFQERGEDKCCEAKDAKRGS